MMRFEKSNHKGNYIWGILLFVALLLPISGFSQNDRDTDKPILFPKLFGLNKKISTGLMGGALDHFNYGAIGLNATIYGVYVDFMGWDKKDIKDVKSSDWEELSVWSSHAGYQIPFHHYKDGGISLIPMIGYYAKREGAFYNVDDETFRVTATTGGFDYGAALAFHSKDEKIGSFNFYIGYTRYTAWTGLGIDVQTKKTQHKDSSGKKNRFFKEASIGIIGGTLDHHKNYGSIGLNVTVNNIYLDFMGWPQKHGSDVKVDKWNDRSVIAAHMGYQIPLHQNVSIIPLIGYANIQKGITDGSDWSISNGNIHNRFNVTEKKEGLDYGASLAFHINSKNILSHNIYLARTRYAMWVGYGIGLSWNK